MKSKKTSWRKFIDNLIDGENHTNHGLVQSLQKIHHRALFQINSDGQNPAEVDEMNNTVQVLTKILHENERRKNLK